MTRSPYSHIACCIEDSRGSRRALEEARRLRVLGPGRLTLLHVAPPSIVYGESLGMPPEDEIAAVASTWLAAQAAAVAEAQSVLLSGHPASAVCAWAREHQPICSSRAPTADIWSGSRWAALRATSPITRRAQSCSCVLSSPDAPAAICGLAIVVCLLVADLESRAGAPIEPRSAPAVRRDDYDRTR